MYNAKRIYSTFVVLLTNLISTLYHGFVRVDIDKSLELRQRYRI